MSASASWGDCEELGQGEAEQPPRRIGLAASGKASGRPSETVKIDASSAEIACAGGALFSQKLGADGRVLPFAVAYPDARGWLKRLAE